MRMNFGLALSLWSSQMSELCPCSPLISLSPGGLKGLTRGWRESQPSPLRMLSLGHLPKRSHLLLGLVILTGFFSTWTLKNDRILSINGEHLGLYFVEMLIWLLFLTFCLLLNEFHSEMACRSSCWSSTSGHNSTAMLCWNNFPLIIKYPLNPILCLMANTAGKSLKFCRFYDISMLKLNGAQEEFHVSTLNPSPAHLTNMQRFSWIFINFVFF